MPKTTWKPFWRWFPPLALLWLAGLTLAYQGRMASIQADLARTERLVIAAQTARLTSRLDRVIGEVRFLAAENELAAFLDTGDRAWLQQMAREYLALSRYARIYDQICYLDEQGREVVRVNFNGGRPTVVPEAALQDKHRRYYFREAMALPAGQIYLSPLDLNIENGTIKHPEKPMIRVAAPVFDARGRRRGIVLVNFLAQSLLDAIQEIGRTSIGDAMLLNGNGYWLLAPDPELRWAFMYPERRDRRLPLLDPQAWEAMSHASSGQILTPRGLWVFHALTPFSEWPQPPHPESVPQRPPASERWILVGQVSASTLARIRAGLLHWLVPIGGGMVLLLAVGVRGISVALTQRAQRQAQLERLARVDAVTGVANRAAFQERLALECERARRHGRRLALVFIDLDGFKRINDTLGHQVGDRVLLEVAATLAGASRREDLVGRYGGDELAMLLPEPPDAATAVLIAEKVREHIAALRWEDQAVTASIGVAVCPDHALEASELLRLADRAMYASKEAGKNRVTLACLESGAPQSR